VGSGEPEILSEVVDQQCPWLHVRGVGGPVDGDRYLHVDLLLIGKLGLSPLHPKLENEANPRRAD
jgi:hypothetical protein